MKISNLNIAEFSDVHLGHPKTYSHHIVDSLRIMFPNNKETSELDIIIIAGDFFDGKVSLSDSEVSVISQFVFELLRICKLNDIVLRVLEGTPSHDWGQSKLFIDINVESGILADVKYIDTLEIEHIDRFDIDVLYIPDEYKPTCDETWSCVTDKLDQHNLEKVDFVIMHGAFPHQMPENLHSRLQLHNPNNFMDICRYFIFVGHIHTFSRHGSILSAGSTDRLRHGEEEPKGHIRVRVDMTSNEAHQIRFIENINAKTYITLNCTGLDEERVTELVDRRMKGLRPDSHVRIKCFKKDAVVAMIPNITKTYHLLNWTVKPISDTETSETEKPLILDETLRPPKGLQITKSNIESLLITRIQSKQPEHSDRAARLLREVLNA